MPWRIAERFDHVKPPDEDSNADETTLAEGRTRKIRTIAKNGARPLQWYTLRMNEEPTLGAV
jgi:hypothetical protein